MNETEEIPMPPWFVVVFYALIALVGILSFMFDSPRIKDDNPRAIFEDGVYGGYEESRPIDPEWSRAGRSYWSDS